MIGWIVLWMAGVLGVSLIVWAVTELKYGPPGWDFIDHQIDEQLEALRRMQTKGRIG